MLRRQGKSLRQIKQILGPISNATLHDALRGEPPADWTRRPNAKDALRAEARRLRAQGLDYEEIATALGVAKSSVSLWVRDVPRPARLGYAECRKRSVEGVERYWAAERSEGTKNKPHRRSDRVVFMNSDPSLIRFFLRFLAATATASEDLAFRVYIHENADPRSAEIFWLKVTGAKPEQFHNPALKRHIPKTERKNVGEDYHGCLRIEVNRSSGLFRKIEGWAEAIMSGESRRHDQASNYLAAPGEGFEPSLAVPKTVVLPG
jgi:transcriptional regulator with XRE-family HTH domain